MRVVLNVISEVTVGDVAEEFETSQQHFMFFFAMWQVVAEGLSDKQASDMEECMKHRCISEFLCEGKKNIH